MAQELKINEIIEKKLDRNKQGIKALLDTDTKPDDYARPGHIFPLKAKKGGVLRRTGHTEAAIDLARLAGFKPAGVLVEILNEDGSMARVPDLLEELVRHHKDKQEAIKQDSLCVERVQALSKGKKLSEKTNKEMRKKKIYYNDYQYLKNIERHLKKQQPLTLHPRPRMAQRSLFRAKSSFPL